MHINLSTINSIYEMLQCNYYKCKIEYFIITHFLIEIKYSVYYDCLKLCHFFYIEISGTTL